MSIKSETDSAREVQKKKSKKFKSSEKLELAAKLAKGSEKVSEAGGGIDGEKKKKRKRRAEASKDEDSEAKKKYTGAENGVGSDPVDSSVHVEEEENTSQLVQAQGAGNASDSEASDREEVSEKEVKRLTGKSFRTSFNSAEGLAMLRKFVTICNENKKRDVAGEYLHAGGSALEVLRLLDTSEKKNISNATTVFSGMHIVIMKILAQYPQYHSSAEEACRHLVNSHLSSVHSMLSTQSNAKQRRVVLRLLAAVASLGGTLPRELLGHLSLHSQVLDTLTKHTKPTDPQSVRTCFIHFVLAFLVEGNQSVIRAFLDKRGVLSSIFPGLMYDSHKTVHLVLTTVKTYVLENPGISKTTKLHTFSTPVVQSLVALYNWKGPKNWPGKGQKKQSSGHTDPEEKQVAIEAVHDFLVTLLTSNRFGIIFNDRTLGTSGRKHNQLVNTILQSLDRPWEHAKPMDLVVKILVACPDLVRPQLIYTEAFLEPRVSKKWIYVMGFIKQIVESIDPETCLKPCLSELAAPQLISAVTILAAPLAVLKNAITPSFAHSSITVRHEAVGLLTAMLGQLNCFTKTVVDNSSDDSELAFFRNSITDYISKNIPSLDSILSAWNNALSPEEPVVSQNQEELVLAPTHKEHLMAILNLLLAYQDVCPQLLDTGSTNDPLLQPAALLAGLNMLDNIDEEELSDMKVKALQFLLALDSSAFVPNKDLFSEALPFLMSLLGHKSALINSHARTTIETLLNASGLFEGCDDQVGIWINSCATSDSTEERVEVAGWLVKVVRNVAKRINKYVELIAKAEEVAGEQVLSTARTDDMFNDFMERDLIGYRMKITMLQSQISISPLLAGALEDVKKNPSALLLRYMSHVTTHTLHCQVAPATFIHLVQNIEELTSKKYICSWMHGSTPTNIKKPFNSKSMIHKLSKALLTDSRIELNEVFTGEKSLSFKIGEEEICFGRSLDANDVSTLLRLSLFYLTQLTQQGKLSEEQNNNIKIVIVSLLHAAKAIDVKECSSLTQRCSKCIFTHPTILQYFSPLYKKKNIFEKLLTITLLDICTAVTSLNEKQTASDLFLPFRDKLVTTVVSAAKKCQTGAKVKDFQFAIRFIEILQLNMKDVTEILKTIISLSKDKFLSEDKTSLSMWGTLIPILIKMSADQRGDLSAGESLTLDKSVIEKIGIYLTQLKKIQALKLDSWETSLLKYLQSFPHNLAGVDTNLFKSLVENQPNRSTVELVSLLVNRNPKFISVYMKCVAQSENAFKHSDAVFPILSSILGYKLEKTFLQKLYSLYKDDIVSCFSDPATAKPWIKENVKAVVQLIESNIDPETCKKTCETVLSNGAKLDSVDVYYVELLECLFKKASKLEANKDSALVDFAQILIHITVSTLKKDAKNIQKLTTLCEALCDTVDLVSTKDNASLFHDLSRNHSWPQFTRFSLKLGLKASKGEDIQVPLLKTLNKLCEVAYKDDSDDEYMKTLFEMTTSHSEFVNVMLGSSSIKRDLVELLWILVRKNKSSMASMHVPLYLGAYNATLSETDQLLLQLLQYYEESNIKLNEYRPYLWGNAAATHYSVKSGTDTALWRQPTTSQVLDLLTQETVSNTVRNYPVHRNLKSVGLYPAQQTYDPAFYLPLLCHLLSDNSVVACHKVTQSGALALALAACGSSCDQTRLGAYTVISRFYFHLEATSSKEKLLWMHFVNALRNGIVSLEPALKDIRLSCLVSTFLARTSLVATQPLNPLYSALQSFLMAKPALDLNTIPELLQLLHSSEIEHKAHRHWILEVIRDGIKTELDVEVALKCVLFRMLFDFYTSSLSDRQTKNLILQVVNSSVKIPKTASLLVNGYALLPWLHETVCSLDAHDLDSVTVLIKITRNLFDSLSRTNEKHTDAYFMLLYTLNTLRSRLSKNISIKYFKDYVNTLGKIISTKIDLCNFLSMNDMKDLVDLSKKLLGEIDECEDMLQFGCKFVAKPKADNVNFVSDAETAKDSLRKLFLTWCTCRPR